MTFLRKGVFFTLLAAGLLVLPYCKSSEPTVTTIEGEPQVTAGDTTEVEGDKNSASFMHLVIGETHAIKSMDPLFATNTSTKRVIQQIYEGLVRYDTDGNIIPAIAAEWTISEDSLTYRFHLRKNVFYHDSDVFAAGTGQQVIADDFRYIFRRMARRHVPPEAARLFMSIRGFEPFYREQHQLFDPDDRKLTEISGIDTPNDTTLVLHLRKQDPYLLQKLATPYAVVYPRQAVVNSARQRTITKPVGSGPFQLSKQETDSLIILTRFDGYWKNRNQSKPTPRLNRVDFVHRSGKKLNAQLNRGNVNVISEISPYIMRQTLDSTGHFLTDNLSENHLLYKGGHFTYRFLYNKPSSEPKSAVHREINSLNFAQLTSNIHPSGIRVRYKRSYSMPQTSRRLTDSLEIPYSNDPFLREIIRQMQQSFKQKAIDFQMQNLKVPLSNTSMIADQQVPLYPNGHTEPDSLTLVSFTVQHWALSNTNVRNYVVNSYPWWLNLREVTLNTRAENL